MTDNKQALLLLDAIKKSIEINGVEGTCKVLELSTTKQIDFNDANVDFTLKMVCAEFKVSVVDLIGLHSQSSNRMRAIRFAAYYLHSLNFFGYSFRKISAILKRDTRQIQRYVNSIKDMNAKDNLMKHKIKFDIVVGEFINSKKSKK